ncbi:MAG: aminopeptidase [Planctomycetes bacterium]|nr:aminopeptidase [Planctomycetota bacterium]
MIFARISILVLALSALQGCAMTSYVLSGAVGQLNLLCRAKPIDDLLARDDLDEDVRDQLEYIEDIKKYAAENFGLETASSYNTYVELDGKPVAWNVSACAELEFRAATWDFPIMGRVEYLGFFEEEQAIAEESRLRAEGYDARVYAIPAYSTLGWFSDPVLSSMIYWGKSALADTIIHELTHATLWFKGNVPFNETLANYTALRAAPQFLRGHFGADSRELYLYLAGKEDEMLFRDTCLGYYDKLDEMFKTDLGQNQKRIRKAELYDELRATLAELKPRLKTTAFLTAGEWDWNNASMMGYRRYNSNIDVFDGIWKLSYGNVSIFLSMWRMFCNSDDPVKAAKEFME